MSSLIPIKNQLDIDADDRTEIWLERIDVLRESYQIITGEDPIDRLREWLKAAGYPMVEQLSNADREPFFKNLFYAMKRKQQQPIVLYQKSSISQDVYFMVCGVVGFRHCGRSK